MTDKPASESSPSASAPAPAPAKRRRWKRIIVITCIVIIAISALFRITIAVAFPSVLRKVAGAYDLNAEYERMDMYLLDGDVGLSHLKITPKTGGESIIDLEYCRGDVSALNLLRGKLVVRRVEVDGVDMHVEREPDGTIPLLRRLMGFEIKRTEARELTIEPPLRIDALRLNRVRARWRDRAVQPTVETVADLTARLSDLGSPLRPTRFLVDITSPPLLDTARIEGEGNAGVDKPLDARISVAVRGIHPKPAHPYLALLGLKPVADDISLACTATVKARTLVPGTTTRPTVLAGDIILENLFVKADEREAAGVDRVVVKVDATDGLLAQLSSVLIDGVRASAERTAAGNVRVAGMELVPAAPAAPATRPSAAPATAGPATAPALASTQPGEPPLRVELAELTIKNVRAAFADASVTPVANAVFVVNTLTARGLSGKSDQVVQIAGDFAAPGIARAIQLNGTARPFAPVRTLDAKLVMTGVRPDALKGYLDAAGVESTLNDGKAQCDLSASLAPAAGGALDASVLVKNIRFSDGAELLAFDTAKVDRASVDPSDGRLKVAAIELAGPKLLLERSADGTVRALGFRTKAATTAPAAESIAAAPAASPTTAPVAAAAIPKLEIRKFTWKGVGIEVRDQAVSPPTTMTIADAGVEMTDVRVGVDPGPTTQPGRIRAWLVAPGLAKQFALTGTVVPIVDGADVTIDVAANGLNVDLLAPYLKALGVEPTLKDGSLAGRARVGIQGSAGAPVRASLAVDNLRYEDQKKELLGVTGVAVKSIELRPDGVAVSTVSVTQPRIRVERDADGALHLAGVKIPTAATQPARQAAAPVPPTTMAATSQPAQPMGATLDQLRVTGASLTWVDRAMMPAVNAAAHADIELDRFVFGKPADPAKLKIAARIDRMLESFVAAGVISADVNAPRAQLDLTASGIRSGELATYLPPGTKISVQNGQFRGKLDAAAPVHPKGGRSVKLVLTDFDYRDSGARQAFVRFDNVNVNASRIDPPGGVVAIEEVSLRGLETEVQQAADGSTKLLGLTIAATPPPQPSAATNGTGHAPPAPKSPPPTTGPSDVKALLAQQQQKPPLVTLDKLDVQLKRVAYVDESKPDAKALALADVRLRNPKRIELLGPDATQRPPVELEIVGRIDPVVGNFNVAIQSAPYAAPATLNVKIAADQIRGEGVTDLLPELREQIDGAPLTDGRFTANIEAQAKIEHRSAGAPDFTRPVEGSVLVRNVEYRAAADSPVLAGVEEIRAEPVRVDAQTGAVSIRTLEITKPIARATREKDGIHVMGLVIRPAATQPAPTGKPGEQPTPPPRPEATLASDTTAPPAQKPAAEIKIDKLLISGIDFHAEDRSVDPPLVVPVNSLELEVRGLSNMAMFENRPIRFNLTTGAGKVPLKDGKERELFSEVAAAGSISLYPALGGWGRSSVSGFEMTALAGVAKEQKVTIENGVFDSNVDVRIADDVLNTRSKFAFTDLRMSEESDGPIGRVLKLPGPLDTMIIVLQDSSGAITVPLNVKVKEYAVGGGQLAGAAITALSSIFATAMASAPLKVAGGVTSVVGLDKAMPFGKKGKETGPQEAGAIAFAPGVTDPTDGRLIDEMAKRLREDRNLELTLRHELGSGDLTLAADRANPPADVCLAMTQQLRQRKAELTATHARLASESRAILLARSDALDPAAELRGADRELAATEQALDRLYDLLRPGAERQADRRTRAACIELADERLATIRQTLTTAGIANIDDRVKVIRAPAAAADAGEGGKVVLTTAYKKKV